MSEEFYFEKNGHMIIKMDKKTGMPISWATIYPTPDNCLENRRFKVVVKIKTDIPILKQVAKIKMLTTDFNEKDKEIINSAKNNGFVNIGIFRPIDAEKIESKGKELGLTLELEEVFINDNPNR